MKKIFVALMLLLLVAFSSCASGVTSTIPESGEYGAYSSNVGFILDYQRTGNNYIATMTVITPNPFYCDNNSDSPVTKEAEAVPMLVDSNGDVKIGSGSYAGEAIPPCYHGAMVLGINFQGAYNGLDNTFILTTNTISNTAPVTITFRSRPNVNDIEKQVSSYYLCNCQESGDNKYQVP